MNAGLPPALAQHVAYLFIRDPLMILEEDLQGDPTNGTQHCDVKYIALTIIIKNGVFIHHLKQFFSMAICYCDNIFMERFPCS